MSTPDSDSERRLSVEFLRHLADSLAAGSVELPTFPPVVIKVQEILRNPNYTTQMIAEPIRSDPTLAARFLNMANSTAFNATGKVIIDLGIALTRLGAQKVYSVVLAHAIQVIRRSESLRSIGRPLDELWSDSVTTAHFCDAVAKRVSLSSADAFVAGLLHRIGHLYILAQCIEGGPSRPRRVLTNDLIDAWHPAIARAILKNWNISQEVCTAVGEQSEVLSVRTGPPTLTDVLIVGARLAKRMRNPHDTNTSLTAGGVLLRLNLSIEECHALISKSAADVRALERVLHP
ncbi:MAG TPA: HDOD domain-containing protein [Steroidobacteraceae bacterium]|jgi:HD-like signal output (HDOD) protein